MQSNARLYDNTRVNCYKTCPRKFFFRHVLHWVPKGTRMPLIFGGAWHQAMEFIWGCAHAHGSMTNETIVKGAYAAWLDYWEKAGMPASLTYEQEKEMSPRTPGKAYEMIVAYVTERRGRFDEFELIAVEQPFVVPLDPKDPTLFYVGKIDKIVRYKLRDKILGIEHKTTTAFAKSGMFRSMFLDSFSPNSQVDGYQYALHMLYPGQSGGVWIDAALVHKEHEAFTFIPIEKQIQHLDSWLWETRDWIRQIEHQLAEMCMTTDADSYMAAFPRNTNSCWDFNSACEYHGICRAWTNPLGRGMPMGYEREVWDPLDKVEGLRELMHEVSDNKGAS